MHRVAVWSWLFRLRWSMPRGSCRRFSPGQSELWRSRHAAQNWSVWKLVTAGGMCNKCATNVQYIVWLNSSQDMPAGCLINIHQLQLALCISSPKSWKWRLLLGWQLVSLQRWWRAGVVETWWEPLLHLHLGLVQDPDLLTLVDVAQLRELGAFRYKAKDWLILDDSGVCWPAGLYVEKGCVGFSWGLVRDVNGSCNGASPVIQFYVFLCNFY